VSGPDLAGRAGKRPRGWEIDRMQYHLETAARLFVAGDARSESAKAGGVGRGRRAGVMLVHRLSGEKR